MGRWCPAAGSGALSAAVRAWDLLKEVGKNIKDKETKEGGTEFCPGKGVLKREVSKHQETFSLPNLCRALEAQRAA